MRTQFPVQALNELHNSLRDPASSSLKLTPRSQGIKEKGRMLIALKSVYCGINFIRRPSHPHTQIHKNF